MTTRNENDTGTGGSPAVHSPLMFERDIVFKLIDDRNAAIRRSLMAGSKEESDRHWYDVVDITHELQRIRHERITEGIERIRNRN